MVGPLQPSEEVLDRAMRRLLLEHPGAGVAAIGWDASIIELPDTIPLGQHPPLTGRTPLDLVEPADRVVVVEAWNRAREGGSGRAPVRMRSGGRAVLHFLDLRAIHGVYTCIAVPQADDSSDDVVDFRSSPAVPPRYGRMLRDELARPMEVDEAVATILAREAGALVGSSPLDLIHPDDRTRAIENWMSVLACETGAAQRWRGRYQRGDGRWIWLEVTNYNRLGDPAHRDVLSEMVDVTEEMAVHEALRAREQLLHRLADALPLGVLQVDVDRRVIYANSRLAEILGTPAAGTVDEQFARANPDQAPALGAAIAEVLSEGCDQELDVSFALPRGGSVVCHLTMRGLANDDGKPTGAIICLLDITESNAMRRELERRATYDALTGCLNRSSVMAELADAMSDDDECTAVLFVDIDRFKPVNDRHGHATGDLLLTRIAERIRSVSRKGDLVGRLGGDEFLVVCPRVTDPAVAVAIAERLSAEVALPAEVGGVTVAVSASVGICWSRNAFAEPDMMVSTADTAMYDAKATRTGHPVLRVLSEIAVAGTGH